MGKHRNEYSVIAIFPSGEAKKWSHVSKLNDFAKFLDRKHSEWLYVNVYNKRTREYLRRFYKGDTVPNHL